MGKVQYCTACTLDGFIADQHNSLDWLFEAAEGDQDTAMEEFMAGVGPLVMGRTTYEWVVDHEQLLDQPHKWQEFYADRPSWVFTHRDLPPIPGADIRFVSGDVRPVYDEMVAAAGDTNIWLIGGGELVGQFDDAGLLDEVWLEMWPVFLGAGAPLLPRRITSTRATLREAQRHDQGVRLIIDIARRS